MLLVSSFAFVYQVPVNGHHSPLEIKRPFVGGTCAEGPEPHSFPMTHWAEQLHKNFSAVIITGASSGIGKALTKAIRHSNPSIRICNLSRTEIEEFSHWSVTHIPTDLSNSDSLQSGLVKVEQYLAEEDCGLKILLINNAGFGSYGPFCGLDLRGELELIDTNLRGLVELTGRLLPILLKRGGAILNVASTAAWQPTPFMATYGASKAFLLHWSLSLHEELKTREIPVCTLCPGPTETRFFRRAGFGKSPIPFYGQTAEAVAEKGLYAVIRGKPFVVSGFFNQLMTLLSSRLPKGWQGPIAGKVLQRMRIRQLEDSSK